MKKIRNNKNAFILPLLFLIFGVSSCFNSSRSPETGGGNKNTTVANSDSNSASTPAASNEKRVLEDKYYQDSDGNLVPDFIETELGYDPNADDCPLRENCGNGASGEDLNKQVNTLLMLDASGSMRAKAGFERKIDTAKQSLKTFVTGAPNLVKMGFLVYGHKGNNTPAGKAESCAADGAEILAPVGGVSADDFDRTLARFEPTGWTPIGLALEKAREAFAGKTGQNRIIMVSDGIETCGGNPVEVARQLHSEGINVTIDVVGLDVGSREQDQLRAIAKAGGGEYYDAKTRSELDEYFKKQREAYNKTMNDTFCLFDALFKMRDCESEFTHKVSDYIGDEIKKIPPGDLSGRYGALIMLNSKMYTAEQARINSYTEIRERIERNGDKANEILKQDIRALGKK